MGRQPTVRSRRRQSQQHASQPIRPSDQRGLATKRYSSLRKPVSPLSGILWLQRHTLLIWLVALSLLMGAATAAIMTILDPNASSEQAVPTVASPIPVPSKRIALEELSPAPSKIAETTPTHTYKRPDHNRSHRLRATTPASPQSAVGAIALSCAAGCFLLSQWFKPSAPKRHILFETQSQPSKQVRSTQDQLLDQTKSTKLASELPAPIELSPPPQPPVTVHLPISFNIATVAQPATASSAPTPEITVLPDEQTHPLDWDEPSLADSLDLRQHRPLSYWL